MMPMLITAYKYAKLRAMGSFDALKRATASVPTKTDILRYETQAINFHHKRSAKDKKSVPPQKGRKTRHTAFIREPHFTLDPHRRRNLLRHPNVRRCCGDRVIIPHGGHLTVVLRWLHIRNLVRAGISRWTARFLGQLGEGCG
jgi:hypothetical protein